VDLDRDDDWTKQLEITVTNNTVCNATVELVNAVTLTESDSGQTRNDSATVEITAPDCPSTPGGEMEGCTYTQGYWKNHPSAWPEGYSPDDKFFSSDRPGSRSSGHRRGATNTTSWPTSTSLRS
jgi:hypothetical protein